MFFVKAKNEGRFPLLLKVTVIEMLYGKERRKEIVLEEMIEVVTKSAKNIQPVFKNAGYAFDLSPNMASKSIINDPARGGTKHKPSESTKPKNETKPTPAPIPTNPEVSAPKSLSLIHI